MNKIKNEQGTLRKLERRVPYFILWALACWASVAAKQRTTRYAGARQVLYKKITIPV
jgi:hypothetical protein